MKLFTPGPVMVHPRVLDVLSRQPLHHRSPEFLELSSHVWHRLSSVFLTKGRVALLAGSAMTGIEAAFTSIHAPNDKVLIISHGRFGDRLEEIALLHGLQAIVHRVEWGSTVTAEDAVEALRQHSDWRGLWFVHCETSTGVTLNAKEIVAEARRIAPDIIVGVDVVTSLATQEFRMDEWQIDVAIAGIQKGLGCPPGLACVAVNDRAERCIAAGDRRIYALDLRRILTDQQNGLFTWTAPTSLVAALATSVDLLLDDGLRTRWKHHARLASMIRSEAQEHGWQEFGDGATSSVVALTLANADEVRSTLAQEFGLVVAGGQDRLKNSIIRIGTMGNLTEEDIIEVLDALNTIMDRA